jgi:hypothetical protein
MKSKNRFSIWIIDNKYYLWYAKTRRYFIFCYQTLYTAEYVQHNLNFGSLPPDYQMIKEKDLNQIKYTGR